MNRCRWSSAWCWLPQVALPVTAFASLPGVSLPATPLRRYPPMPPTCLPTRGMSGESATSSAQVHTPPTPHTAFASALRALPALVQGMSRKKRDVPQQNYCASNRVHLSHRSRASASEVCARQQMTGPHQLGCAVIRSRRPDHPGLLLCAAAGPRPGMSLWNQLPHETAANTFQQLLYLSCCLRDQAVMTPEDRCLTENLTVCPGPVDGEGDCLACWNRPAHPPEHLQAPGRAHQQHQLQSRAASVLMVHP